MAKLVMHHSLARAQKVLDLVMADQRTQELYDEHSVGAYQNGREQGFHISTYNWVNSSGASCIDITWGENRNSDDIVVYVGPGDNQGISEEAWKNAKYFKHDEYREAADYIIEQLMIYDSTKAQFNLTKEAR